MALPQIAESQTVTQRVFAHYNLSGISAWPNGSSTATKLSSTLLGPTWSFGPTQAGGLFDLEIPSFSIAGYTFPSVDLGKTGAEMTFGGSGQLGLQATPWYNGGTLDVSYGGGVSLTYPEFPTAGSSVTVKAAFAADSGSSFTTYSPDFGISLAAAFQISGYASSSGYFLGDQLWSGSLFPSFSVGGSSPKPIGQFTDFANLNQINSLVNAINPSPVGASISIPTVAANAFSPDSKGVLQAASFGKFLSVQTDALSWIALLFGDAKPVVFDVLQGNYTVPDTSLQLSWDICKAYADLDIGFNGTYTLVPLPQISLTAYDSTGKVVAQGGSTLTFKMPATSVNIVPSLTLDLQFRNQLAFATQGELGIDPFDASLIGGYGHGINAQTLDIDFQPANEDWTSNTSGGISFIDKTFNLPLTQGQRIQQLAGVGINAADLLDLPREVFVGSAPTRTIEVPAYTPDSDKDYATVTVTPEQGRTFLFHSNGAGQTLAANMIDPQTGLVDNVNIGSRDNTSIELQIPRKVLIPGQTTLSLFVQGFNSLNQFRQAKYTLVTTIYHKTPNIAGGFFTGTDMDPTKETNRIVANGQDQWIYCDAGGIYKTTKALLNTPGGPIVLPTDITTDQDPTGKSYIGIKVPASVASKYAGGIMSIQLQNPNLLTDSSGGALPPLLSNASPIYFVAGRPQVSSITVKGSSAGVPLGDKPAIFSLNGSGFTALTSVYMVGLQGGSDIENLSVSYSSPNLLHVTVPASILRIAHDYQQLQPKLYASTPFAIVPGDAQNALGPSGGISNSLGVSFVYPKPIIQSLNSSILVRQVANQLVVTGLNLFTPPRKSSAQLSSVTIQGRNVPANEISYISAGAMTASGLKITLPSTDANLQEPGARDLFVSNNRVQSTKRVLQVVNGAPKITVASIDAEVGPGIANRVTLPGGPFYPESKFTVNGANAPLASSSITGLVANLNESLLSHILGQTTTGVVFTPTPGGGTSNSVQIRLLERDPATIKITKGSLTYDRGSQTWAQPLICTYTGSRILSASAELQITGLASGTTFVNPDGIDDGTPFKTVQLANGQFTTVSVRFKKPAVAVLSYQPTIHFAN